MFIWKRKLKCVQLLSTSLILPRHISRIQLLDRWKSGDKVDCGIFQNGQYMLCSSDSQILVEKRGEKALHSLLYPPDGRYNSVRFKDCSSSCQPLWFSHSEVRRILEIAGMDQSVEKSSYLLGIDYDSTALWARQLQPFKKAQKEDICKHVNGAFLEIRPIFFLCSPGKPVSFGKLFAILKWHQENMFCSHCGTQLIRNDSGSKRICTACKINVYPKCSTSVLSVVTDEVRKQCLVVRGPKYPPGMYTGVAGFLEVGETLEEAVVREIGEEVGLEVENLTFVCSQHWPLTLPSLCSGFMTTVKSGGNVKMCPLEIEDYRWLDPYEVGKALEVSGKNPGRWFDLQHTAAIWLPPQPTLANHLFHHWLDKIAARWEDI